MSIGNNGADHDDLVEVLGACRKKLPSGVEGMDRKAGERALISVCWRTAVAGLLAYVLLQFIPSIRVGITLSIFGVGFIAFAWTGGKVGIAVWKIWPVYRSEQPGLFLVLLVCDVITGIALIVLGWGIQIYIVNAPPRANPLPPDHPEYENYQVGSLGKPESDRFIIKPHTHHGKHPAPLFSCPDLT